MVLSKLSHRSSCEFLFRRSSQKYISEFETMQGLKLLEREDPEEYYALYYLASEDGIAGLPIALEQAGAFLLHTESSFKSYVKEFKQAQLELLQKCDPEIGIDEDDLEKKKLQVTFNMSLEQLPKRSIELLMLLSFLDADNIDDRLILTCAQECPREDIKISIQKSHRNNKIRPWTKVTFVESQYYNLLIQPLVSLSLLTVTTSNKSGD